MSQLECLGLSIPGGSGEGEKAVKNKEAETYCCAQKTESQESVKLDCKRIKYLLNNSKSVNFK